MRFPSRFASLVHARTALGVVLLGALPLLGGAAARAQSALYVVDGDSAEDYFGGSVSGAGDVDADGVPDFIVGAHGDDNNGLWSGSARVFSGRDGTILFTFDGDAAGDRLGKSVSGAGDVDGDGYADLIVGAYFDDNTAPDAGAAFVYSGRDGARLYTLDGFGQDDFFGVSVSGAGDVNGDGFDDVLVGAANEDSAVIDDGTARVYSGLDGTILYTFVGDAALDYLGVAVSEAGDVNGDGFDDVIAGAFGDDDNGPTSGSARVFSGADGSTLYTFHGDAAHDHFGAAVGAAGDVNGDGHADLIVGAPDHDANGADAGRARVFSGLDGSTLYTFDGESEGDRFGVAVSGAGDVDADGHADVLVGAHYGDQSNLVRGRAFLFSGLDGRLLYVLQGDSSDDRFGASLDGLGDVNGDGFDDLIVGAQGDDNNGVWSGSARVVSGRDAIGSSYCGPALPNSTNLPGVLVAVGSDRVADGDVMLRALQLPPGQFGYFIAGETQGFFNPPGTVGFVCLAGNIGRYNALPQLIQGPSGNLQLDLASIPVNPAQPVLPGETWNFQCWFRDNNPTPTSNFTDAVTILFL